MQIQKLDYIAQAACYEDIDEKQVIIGANPYTAEQFVNISFNTLFGIHFEGGN